MTNLEKLIAHVIKDVLQLEISINECIEYPEENLADALNKLYQGNEISLDVMTTCLKENVLVTIKYYPINMSDNYFYSHGPNAETCAESIIKEAGI